MFLCFLYSHCVTSPCSYCETSSWRPCVLWVFVPCRKEIIHALTTPQRCRGRREMSVMFLMNLNMWSQKENLTTTFFSTLFSKGRKLNMMMCFRVKWTLVVWFVEKHLPVVMSEARSVDCDDIRRGNHFHTGNSVKHPKWLTLIISNYFRIVGAPPILQFPQTLTSTFRTFPKVKLRVCSHSFLVC